MRIRTLYLFSLLCLLAGSASAQTILYVTYPGDTSGTNYGSLREAVMIANASPSPAIIRFSTGLIVTDVTKGRIDITSDITIEGISQNMTILDGNEISNGFNVWNTGRLTLNNLTMRNFNADEPPFHDNGGAVTVYGGQLTIFDCRFENNIAQNAGGAVFVSDEAQATITESQFINNSSQSGGAIRFQNGNASQNRAFLTVEDCLFQENQSAGDAGALCLLRSVASIKRSQFIGNSANSRAGALFSLDSELLVATSMFKQNASNSYCIYAGKTINNAYPLSFKMSNSEVVGNSISLTGNQAAMFHLNVSPYEISNCLIAGNKQHVFYYEPEQMNGRIVNCTIAGNEGELTTCTAVNTGSVHEIANSIVAKNGIHVQPSWRVPFNSVGGNVFDVPAQGVSTHSGDLVGSPASPVDVKFKVNPSSYWPNVPTNLRLKACSPAVNFALNSNHPADFGDVDGDNVVAELLPLDLNSSPRIYNSTSIDAGAYELQGPKEVCSVIIRGPRSRSLAPLLLYPNPNNGTFTLSLSEKDQSVSSYKVYDKFGAVVAQQDKSENMATSELKVQTGKLKPGVYVVEVVTRKGDRFKKSFMVK